MKHCLAILAVVFFFLSGVSCAQAPGDTAPGTQGSACELTWECRPGLVCRDSVCVQAEASEHEPEKPDEEEKEPDEEEKEPEEPEEKEPEPDEPEPEEEVRMTFVPDDYRRCFDDLDCAVFGGNCLVDLALNRPDLDGRDRVAIAEIDDSFEEGQGVCSFPCTNDPRVCQALMVDRPDGGSVSFSCQLIFEGTSPYPSPRPVFPFDHALDPDALARGTPYASICRPPFQHAKAHSEFFCERCVDDDMCGDGDRCYMEQAYASPSSGSCVSSCEANTDCPFGFSCEAYGDDGATFCIPEAGTCGRCRDMDGNLRGTGRCGPIDDPITAVDCDDTNPDAYYDPNRMDHPFPEFCGDFDYNCDGLSDRQQQLGTAEHCAECFDVCSGAVDSVENAVRRCASDGDGYFCDVVCDSGFANCDGLEDTGCETRLGRQHIWAPDRDGDGRGCHESWKHFCPGDEPKGWVNNNLDCNDYDPTVYGGCDELGLAAAPELCDGKDNSCDGVIDGSVGMPADPSLLEGVGAQCDTGRPGICKAGRVECVNFGNTYKNPEPPRLECVSKEEPVLPPRCDGRDDNCDGVIDSEVDRWVEEGLAEPGHELGPMPCDADGVGACAQGFYSCALGDWVCVPNEPAEHDTADGVDRNCDGLDGDLEWGVFVRPVGGGGFLDGCDDNDGHNQRPVASLRRALQIACANGAPCRDIYVHNAVYTVDEALEIPTFEEEWEESPVRIFGGYESWAVCEGYDCHLEWQRGTGRARLTRQPPARQGGPRPFGHSYAAIEAKDDGPLSLLLEQVDVLARAPSSAQFLGDEESGPVIIGVRCGTKGCGNIELRDVVIEVQGAPAGGGGDLAAPSPQPNRDGLRGCCEITEDDCEGITRTAGYSFLIYRTRDLAVTEGSFRGEARSCPHGLGHDGGESSPFMWPVSDTRYSLRSNALDGSGWGLGGQAAVWEFMQDEGPGQPAERGVDGRGGGRGSHNLWSNPRAFLDEGKPLIDWMPRWGSHQPGVGGPGGGGGGGAGCMNSQFGNWETCMQQTVCFQDFEFFGQARGGGGGAGGCGGAAGRNGGHGGSAIGIVMHPPDSGEGSIVVADDRELRIVVGPGGDGGDGSDGGDGGAGGYGGEATVRNLFTGETLTPPVLQGGHGGDGAGGGAGSGGYGGHSMGIARLCDRWGANEERQCGMRLPPLMLAEPNRFIQVSPGGLPGLGGVGGEVGEKPLNPMREDSEDVRRPHPWGGSRGTDGWDGQEGRSHALYFTSH